MSALLSVSLGRVPSFPVSRAVLAFGSARERVLQRHCMSRSVRKREYHIERCRIHYGVFGCGVGCTGWTTEGPALVVSLLGVMRNKKRSMNAAPNANPITSQRFPPLLLGPSGSVIETSSIDQLAHDETGDNNCCKYRYQADDNGTDHRNSQP